MDVIQSILNYIDDYSYLAYFLVFFFAATESTIGMSMLLPGSLSVMALGALSAFGSFKIYYIIPIAILGAVIGDNISYFLGRKFGRKFLQKFNLIDNKTVKAAEEFIERHGAKSVALGRFVPFIKETIPFVAGTLNMNRKKFFVFNVLGAIGWAFMWPGTGYIFAKAVLSGEKWVSVMQLLVAFIIFAYLTNLFISEFVLKHYKINILAHLKNILHSRLLFRFIIYILFSYALFIALAIAVIESKPVVELLDTAGFNYIYIYFNNLLFLFFKLFTWTSKWYVLLLLLVLLYILYFKKYINFFLSLILGFFATSFAVHFLKHSIARMRPEYMRIVEDGYAFPSGHAALSSFVALFFAYFIIKHNFKRKYLYVAAIFIWAILISVSRVYLGVHYMSDVLGGIIIAIIFTVFSVAVYEYLENARINSKVISLNNKLPMMITSPAFSNGEFIPTKYTCDGENISPELHITNIPEEAKSLVIIMDDPDVPEQVRKDRHFTHWLLYNINLDGESSITIPENNTKYSFGLNDAGESSYIGPCPPVEFSPTEHRYFFKVYALNEQLNLPDALTQKELENEIKDYIIAQSELMGRYDRSK